jgi:hypothetical protein
MPRPGIPEKAIKILSARNKRDPKKKNKKKKQDLIKRIGGSSRASLLCLRVPNSMTFTPSGYHARAVTFGCMAKGKGVSSQASLIISLKVLVGNTVSSSHHTKALSSG